MKKMVKKLPLVIVSLLLIFSLFAGCSDDSKNDEPPVVVIDPPVWIEDQIYEMVLLHTNDHHGTILPYQAANPGPIYGGLAERATLVRDARANYTNVLLVDAGDINTGSPLSNMNNAEPDIRAYNMMGYDAATFGNHEFDKKLAVLNQQISWANFDFVSSNIKTAGKQFLGGHQYIVKNYDGFRVGIIGLTTLRAKVIASPDPSLTFINEIQAAKDAVALLRDREKVGIVIALTHMGTTKETPDFITSTELAEAVSGIDIIVDGHSHTKFNEPAKVENTYIVSASYWGLYVGSGKLSIKNGALNSFDWESIQIDDSFEPAADIAAMLQPYIDDAAASLNEVIGNATADFDFGTISIPGGPTTGNTTGNAASPRCKETAIGNLLTDSYASYFRTEFHQDIDFAFTNGGGIRANLSAGDIKRSDILTVLPFNNFLYVISLKGDKVQELFDFIPGALGIGAFPQFSKEVRYTLDRTVSPNIVKDITIGGAAIDPNKTYRICTNDFILGGGDDYTMVKDNATEVFDTSMLLSTILIEYIKSTDGITTPATDGRVKFELP
jgi:5'-nucleotidase/UDP-sugar diphosphatase